MLELLHIENIAIIERADILFGRGFNALTGETGAGKSIVIDALGAVLGQRTSRELIRTGAEKAFVSATFSAVPADLPGLAENGFTPEEDGTLLLQRELYGDGKNVCRVGGRPVTVAQLKRIGASLLNIHGQHDGQQLLDEEQHLVYLDRFGRVENELAAYCTRYDVMKETRRAIDALKMDEAEKARRVDMLHHQIGELECADLQEGEEETLLARRNILRNGEKFISAISEADACLNGGDEGLGAVSAIKEAEDALRSLRSLGDEFITLSERLEALRCEAYDLAETVRDKKDEYDFSPQELDAVESRCDQLYRLKKKYGSSVEEMLAYLEKSREELDRIEYADDRVQQLEQTLKKQEKAAREAAQALSDRRHAAAKELEERISRELRELDMPKLRFAIDFQEKDMGEDGVDAVAFLMSANVGAAPHPEDRVRRRAVAHHAGAQKRAGRAGQRDDDGVRRGRHRRFGQGCPARGGKARQALARTASAVRDASAAARGDGRHALRRGKGRGKRPHAHKGRRARPRGAPQRDRPPKRGRPPERDDALRSRGTALRGGEL